MSKFIKISKLKQTSNTGRCCINREGLSEGDDIALINWKYKGREFIERMIIHESHVYISIVLLGTNSDSRKYMAFLDLTNRDKCHIFDEKLSQLHHLDVQSIEESTEMDKIKQNSLKLPLQYFMENIAKKSRDKWPVQYEWISQLQIVKLKRTKNKSNP